MRKEIAKDWWAVLILVVIVIGLISTGASYVDWNRLGAKLGIEVATVHEDCFVEGVVREVTDGFVTQVDGTFEVYHLETCEPFRDEMRWIE